MLHTAMPPELSLCIIPLVHILFCRFALILLDVCYPL
uniref:Uncharacterized protein n=1 Tax=Arundo donax TaxID=35708 RepID=A0A0A9A1P2_ARUDO